MDNKELKKKIGADMIRLAKLGGLNTDSPKKANKFVLDIAKEANISMDTTLDLALPALEKYINDRPGRIEAALLKEAIKDGDFSISLFTAMDIIRDTK